MPIRPEHDAQEQRWIHSKASMPGMRTGTDSIIYFDTKAILRGRKLHDMAATVMPDKRLAYGAAIASLYDISWVVT